MEIETYSKDKTNNNNICDSSSQNDKIFIFKAIIEVPQVHWYILNVELGCTELGWRAVGIQNIEET
jgi:hypothetical protein